MPNYSKRQVTLQHPRQLVVYDTRQQDPNSAKTIGWLFDRQQRPQEKTPRHQISADSRLIQTQKFSLVLLVVLLGSLWLSGCAGVVGHAEGEATAPSITAQPANQTMSQGQTATFSVAATGTAPLSYVWQKNGSAISGANSSSYTTPPLTASDNLEQFRVVVSNKVGAAMSNSATLDVAAATGTAVAISPNTATITTGATQQFTATVTGNSNTGVTWSVSGAGCSGAACGTISGGGLYTAPANAPSPATLRVTVTSVADPTKSASANITVVVATAILMSISPASASVPTAGNESFTATVSGTQNTAVTWSLSGSGCSGAACGTLATSSLTAVYTAPGVAPTPPSVTLMATSVAEPGKTASASVTIVPIVSVTVTPATVSLATGATQQFSSSVVGSSNTAVTWSVQGTGCSGAACGTISSAGLYTAPSAVPSPATVTVTATSSADSTKSASATVAIFSASSTNTANSLTIPATHPRLFWTPARIATAKAWVASAKYAGLNTASPRPLDDYDMQSLSRASL